MGLVLIMVGFYQSWNVAFGIFNLCVISAVMALGVNMQWGYAGLFNVGVMGFTALGGLTAVLVSMPPVAEAWAVAGGDIALSVLSLIATVAAIIFARRAVPRALRLPVTLVLLLAGYFVIGYFFGPATDAIESINPALSGYLGGAGLPVVLAWPIEAVRSTDWMPSMMIIAVSSVSFRNRMPQTSAVSSRNTCPLAATTDW